MNELYDVLNGFIEIQYKIQAMLYVLGRLEVFSDDVNTKESEMVVSFVKYYLEQVEKDMDEKIQELDCCERHCKTNTIK